jgi:tetratricopeptide (TPR) repeat protein
VRQSTARGRRMALLAAALLFAGSMGAEAALVRREARAPRTAPLLYLPSGRYLKTVALGFDGLFADVLYLWSIQYYSNYAIADRYDYLEHIYRDVISELDPRYLDPYLVGALIMTSEAQQPEMALRLLDKGIARNPGAWILSFEAGFVCDSDLKDYARAGAYFERAMAVPGAPPLIRRFNADMSRRSGDLRASLREWTEIHDGSQDAYVRTISWNHVHDLAVQIDLQGLQGAISAFRERAGRAPYSLAELSARGLLHRPPLDPEGRSYLYDPATGTPSYGGITLLGR